MCPGGAGARRARAAGVYIAARTDIAARSKHAPAAAASMGALDYKYDGPVRAAPRTPRTPPRPIWTTLTYYPPNTIYFSVTSRIGTSVPIRNIS